MRPTLWIACCLLLFAACKKSETTPPERIVPDQPETPVTIPATPEMTAQLAKADAKDGAVDKVVHRCAGCNLGMDGKALFPLAVGEYTMHFCKPKCLELFRKDAQKELLALKIPD